MEGMMAGQPPFSFLLFNRGADERSNRAVGSWIRSWLRTKDWGGLPLEEVPAEAMFKLKNMQAARLGIMVPAVKEIAMKLFGDDRFAHPQWPHVFVVPRLMTPMKRKNLGEDADVLFTVPVGVSFWTAGRPVQATDHCRCFPSITRAKVHMTLVG